MALIFLLIGAAVGGVLAIGFGAGMGAAGGLVMGAQAGVCLAADTAREKGLADPETLNAIIMQSIATIRTKAAAVPSETGIEWVQDADGCAELLEKFSDGPKPREG
ncbi:hypothetical protein [Imhoffiella purpurea]|uniref:Uncharacterized protein n=1 Tax=Imhoffiella purpurea TaxID=1249627 RepID=W9VVS8_9GAMM|nr:hypothetical protein [Imhoffiella purpurea]EXJ14550.1 hypothetical protein D779_2691 [Imhoffiella purpurea]